MAGETLEVFRNDVSEQMRLKLLKEEFRLRKKQPTAWTKTKYRPYANFRAKKLEKNAEKEKQNAEKGAVKEKKK